MNESNPGEPQRRSIKQELGDVVANWTPEISPGPILDALHVADQAIEGAAGVVFRGATDVFGDVSHAAVGALAGLDAGALASAAGDVASDVAGASADVAGEVLGAVAEGIGGALSG